MLDTQYRMRAEICQWPSSFFYENKLLTASNLQNSLDRQSPLQIYRYWVLNKSILCSNLELFLFICRVFDVTVSKEQHQATGIYNEHEANFVIKLIQVITRCPEVANQSIGVITFYRNQRMFLDSEIRNK